MNRKKDKKKLYLKYTCWKRFDVYDIKQANKKDKSEQKQAKGKIMDRK